MAKFTVEAAPGVVVIRAGDAVLAESPNALILREGDYAPVFYLPRADVGTEFLDRSDKTSVCPDKGTASYYHIAGNSGRIENAAWSYETPVSGAEAIAEHLAFYSDKTTIETL